MSPFNGDILHLKLPLFEFIKTNFLSYLGIIVNIKLTTKQ